MDGNLEDLEPLFCPRSIAVVGASANQRSQGYEYVEGLVKIGFPGPVYPVNPKLDELLGLKAYARLEDIPGTVDFVISAVPAGATFDLVEGAKAKKTKLIHFYTARFSETGRADDAEAERELRRRTREAGIRVIGPNCMGLFYPKQRITFDPDILDGPGNIGFLSQSGSHAFRVAGRGRGRGLLFSKIISYGNALDLNEADFLYHFARDPDTDIIAAYIEGLRDGRRFFEALRYAAERKPVLVLKGGRTSAGHAAAASHTASLASELSVWKIAVRQAGALEVGSLNELIDMLVAFRCAGLVKGPRAAVLGGAGGGTVEAADLCNEAGLELTPIPREIRDEMRDKIPHAWDWIGNPIDASIIGMGEFNEMHILQLMAANPAYDLVLINFHVERALRRMGLKEFPREVAQGIRKLATDNGKALAIVIDEPEMRDETRFKAAIDARDMFGQEGVAVYPTVERAVQSMGAYVRYQAERDAR
ncbi:MAG TPA: CoA-binding protein [Dehalococcoidia bacterium]|nr:CoA-binding protein [Dehalococcoidia bacterium]